MTFVEAVPSLNSVWGDDDDLSLSHAVDDSQASSALATNEWNKIDNEFSTVSSFDHY